MATTNPAPGVLPGDVIQDKDGLFYLVTQTYGWGCSAVLRSRVRGDAEPAEYYYRLNYDQFWVVGAAPMLPEAVAQARRDAIKTAKLIEQEKGA